MYQPKQGMLQTYPVGMLGSVAHPTGVLRSHSAYPAGHPGPLQEGLLRFASSAYPVASHGQTYYADAGHAELLARQQSLPETSVAAHYVQAGLSYHKAPGNLPGSTTASNWPPPHALAPTHGPPPDERQPGPSSPGDTFVEPPPGTDDNAYTQGGSVSFNIS